MKDWRKIVRAFYLPAGLAGIFVAQNQVFNSLVGLSHNPHLPFFITVSFSLGVFLYGPAVFFGKRGRYAYLFLISLAVSLIFISQYLYFSFFGGFLQASALKYAGQLGSVGGTVISLFNWWIAVFLLPVFLVAAAFWRSRAGKSEEILLSARKKAAAGMSIAALVIFGYGALLATDENGWEKIINIPKTIRELNGFVYSPNDYVQQVGICNYYLGDIIGMAFRSVPITEADISFVQNWFLQKPAPEGERLFGAAKGKNLILIQFESLENVVINQKIAGQEITPTLNALSKQGLYFTNYYTQIGPGNTADAEFVTLNSLYPLTNTVAFVDFAHNKYDALPNLAKENGYHAYVLHGGVPTFWNRANIYPALGYENIISKNDFSVTENGFETLPDDDLFLQSLEKMASFETPFMATIITLTSHTPFTIPEKYQTLSIPAESNFTDRQKNYLQSIHYSDAALGTFIQGLKERDLYQNSLIVIFGDHGTATKITDAIATSTNNALANLRENQVPLIILYPGGKPPLKKTVKIPGSHLDLYPTIANLLGFNSPKNIFGQDLLDTKTPVVTRRDPYSKAITDILTPTLAYESGKSGKFEDGNCLKMPGKTPLPLADCQKIYDEQSANLRASDLVVKGNLLPRLSQNKNEASPAKN